MNLLSYQPTRIQEIEHPAFQKAGIRLLIKREDLNHPFVSGNKWWKLKYNLAEAVNAPHKTVLTFGGAFSNHLYATAAAAHELGLKSLGIVRGEETLPLNPTLHFVTGMGMKLHYISREAYRKKTEPGFLRNLQEHFGDFYLIPEGGSNTLAVKGCAEFARTVLQPIDFDYLFLPVGTGGTIAGMICGLDDTRKIIGIPVLKNGDFLAADINKLIQEYTNRSYTNWSLLTQYHHGGYARTTPALLAFIREMNDRYDLPLDQVYTGKLMWAIIREAESGSLKAGSTVLALHTGGLQGAASLSL